MMELDEAIKHCLEVAEKNEIDSITYKNCKEIKTNMYEKLLAEKVENDCLECAADHRRLAEWLTELKEAKRLLKLAVEDIHELLCDKKNLDGNGQSCNICSYIEWCPCCKECTIREDLRNWRYADEAKKLLNDEEQTT